MPSLVSVPAFIKNAIDPELLKTADKIEYSIEKGEEMTTSYHFKPSAMEGGDDYFSQQHALNKSYHQRPAEQSPGSNRRSRKSEYYDTNWDINGGDSGGEYSPSSPSLASRKYTPSTTSGGYREERIFSKSSALPVTMSKHTIEYMDESSPVNGNPSEMRSIDRSAEWNNWYNREIAPAMERNNVDGSRQWQEWSKREVSTTTPITPFEERTITYQTEVGTSLLNPEASIKTGPGSQVIKHETFEEETSEQTFTMPEPPKVIRSDSGFFDKFKLTRERARSASPPASLRKSVNFGSVAEITSREQEFYPFRDAHQGKPLPGDNEFGTWGRGRNDPERQWKLSNGQWVRVGGKKQRDGDAEPDMKNWEKHLADALPKKKPEEPKKRAGSSSSPLDSSRDRRSKGPIDFSKLDLDNDPDRRALIDKYRSKPDNADEAKDDLPEQQSHLSAGLEPEKPDYKVDVGDLIKRYEPELEQEPAPAPEPEPEPREVEEPSKRIVLEPVQKLLAEPKTPVKMPTEEDEKRMDDPNLMWMKMGPAQYGPPFGSLKRHKRGEEEWVGPPCELCHKQIEERRCMLAENMKFHCWHFACSFCMKTLKVNDFLVAQSDKKPYCLNCHKREFPEISLVNVNLDDE